MEQNPQAFGPGVPIASSRDVFALLSQSVRGQSREHLWRLELQGARVRSLRLISVGRIDTLVPSAPEVFAGLAAGSRVVLAHNHLSQDVAPRDCDDIAATLLDLAALARGLTLHDFLILSDAAYFSFRDTGRL